MGFQLKSEEPLERGFRRIVKDQIDKALGDLNGPSDEVVHEVRKRFKRVRAVLRLARPGLGRKLYERENARFRDAARPLSEVRDAEALVEAFDALVGSSVDPGPCQSVEAIRRALAARKEDLSRRVFGEGNPLESAASAVAEARRGVKRWKVAGDGRDVLEAGLKRIYRRGSRAFREATASPSDEHLHEWRKRVKDLWHVLELLRSIGPDDLRGRAEEAHQVADLLGDDHDLAVLRLAIADPDAGFGTESEVAPILARLDRRRSEIQAEAISLGRSVYARKPGAFVELAGLSR